MSALERLHAEIDEQRAGSGYFSSQKKRLCFNPVDYIKYRALPRHQSACLIHEWTRWMTDLKKSLHEPVRRAAASAPTLTQDDIDGYYRGQASVDREQASVDPEQASVDPEQASVDPEQASVDRELDALESPKRQLRIDDQKHVSPEASHSTPSPKKKMRVESLNQHEQEQSSTSAQSTRGESDQEDDQEQSSTSAQATRNELDQEHASSDLFLPKTLFDEGDNVDEYFFHSPVSEWRNIRAFCSTLLRRDFKISCATGLRQYRESLLTVKRKAGVSEQVRDHANKALGIRESSFRGHFMSEESEIAQASTPAQDIPPYMSLWDSSPIPGDPYDDDFMSIASSQSGSDATQEDLTGEIPEPTHVDRLVGPGTISSQLSGNIDDRLVHQECDISEILMKHRRSRIKEKTQFERSDLLILNFVVTRKLLLTLVPVASVNAVFPPHVPVVLDPTDQDFVARFCAQASTVSFEELYDWLSQQPGTGMSLVRRAATMFLAEAGLWANVNWHAEGSGDNEGLFINILIQPLLVAAFGAFVGCASRWTRDPLCSGEATDLDAQPALSEYQLSYGSDSIVLGEFNTPVASETQMEDGYVRLVCMGKKSVDSLFAKGFPSPVVLIHGRGMVVDVYRLSLRAEAAYFLEALGTFCLVSGPYKFSQLLGLGPLVSAQLTARSTFETIKSKSQVSTNKSWMRGTFDYKGVTIPS